MASTYYITAVHTEQPPGYSHPHITKVRLRDGTVETRDYVINFIVNFKMEYLTDPPGATASARVIVAQCPQCGSGDYITTAPDWTTENNLLDLPRF